MRRGTTPTHRFTVPFEIPSNSNIRIVYAQNDHIVLERTTESCTIAVDKISIDLTSEETLLFDCSLHYINGKKQQYPVEIQVGIQTPDGKKMWSDIIETDVERCLRKDGVI